MDYISDALGFRVAATNLPVAHESVPASEVTLNKVPVAQVVAAEAAPVLQEVHQVLAPVAASDFTYEIDPAVIAAPAVEAAPAKVAVNVPVEVPIKVEALPAVQPAAYYQPYASTYYGYAPAYYGGSYVHPQPVVVSPEPAAAVPVAQPTVVAPATAPVATAAAVVVPEALSVPVSSQHHAQSELGEYNYGYSNVNSAKVETKTADGVTRGSYSYVDANGVLQTTNYVSDPIFGFRVAATNIPVHAPVAAPAPEAVAAPVVTPKG